MIRSSGMFWQLKTNTSPTSLQELEELLLKNRGITDPSLFFHPKHPSELPLQEVSISPDEVTKAIDRIHLAITNQEQIVVFGDYDADGVCSTTVLWQMLHAVGANVTPFVPHREKHGYGMTDRSLDALFEQVTPNLVITVDNGIVAHLAAARLAAAQVDLIITDHHQPEKANDEFFYPESLAIIHSTKLCGTTVAWMLAREISRVAIKDSWPIAKEYLLDPENSLDLCAIATVADQMVMLNANRSFVVHGLKALQVTTRPGLKALFEAAAIIPKEISATTINYGIGPRINAMGRLDHSLEAVRLLCTQNPQRAAELASVLSSTNVRRQDLTSDMMTHAEKEAQAWLEDNIIVVASSNYHEGVIGLIAGKLTEIYSKPAIVISVGKTAAKASARSVPGVNVVELIRQVREDLLEVGGHPMAAGFGLLPEKIEIVMDRLRALAKETITEELLQQKIELECSLPTELLTKETATLIEQFEPFGQGNTTPIFELQPAQITNIQTVGKQGNHLKLGLLFKGSKDPIWAMGWGMAEEFTKLDLSPADTVKVAGCLELNHWNGKSQLQIILKDFEV